MNDRPNKITDQIGHTDPEPRLLMGPGPVDVYPQVLRAMSQPMLGQFDPQFTGYMNEIMTLYREIFRTKNQWTLLVNGTARSGIEACLTSIIQPGDKVLVPRFGRFGHLMVEIARRSGGEVTAIDVPWGEVFDANRLEEALREHKPDVVAVVHGDTSTTMAQPLAELGALCRQTGALLYVDATATVGGNAFDLDGWQIDAVSSGLQKCLSGPPGTSPISINERVEERVLTRKHVEGGIRPEGFVDATGPIIQSNYFDLPMLMDYWSPKRLNHHTESTSMLYAAHECARVVLAEGIDQGIARHALSSRALRAGLEAMGLELFGDVQHRMHSVTGVYIPSQISDGEKVRSEMLEDFGIEIGTSFGPLHGKIWRLGTMGYVCRKANILRCLISLEAVLRRNGFAAPVNAGLDAAYEIYNDA